MRRTTMSKSTSPPVIVVVDSTVGTPAQQAVTFASVRAQTRKPDFTFVVFNGDSPPPQKIYQAGATVLLLANTRTPGSQGAFNTGIMRAVSRFGQDCWIATLGVWSEWQQNHLELCLRAVTKGSPEDCKWVSTGVRTSSGDSVLPPPVLPDASTFFVTTSGIRTRR